MRQLKLRSGALADALVSIASTRVGVVARPVLCGRHTAVFERLCRTHHCTRLGPNRRPHRSRAFLVPLPAYLALLDALEADGFCVMQSAPPVNLDRYIDPLLNFHANHDRS